MWLFLLLSLYRRSPGRGPLSDSGLSISECSGGGSDGPGVGSCVCSVRVERL